MRYYYSTIYDKKKLLFKMFTNFDVKNNTKAYKLIKTKAINAKRL